MEKLYFIVVCQKKVFVSFKRFPFSLVRRLGSGGFATIYEGSFHGKIRAFKFVPLESDRHKFNTKSYGCHEYYAQENNYEIHSGPKKI